MRTKSLTFGIILLFISIIVASSSRLYAENANYVLVNESNNVWKLSANFNSSDVMVAYFSPPNDLKDPYGQLSPDNWWYHFIHTPYPLGEYLEHLNFTIFGPTGDKTIFNVSIGAPPSDWGIMPDEETGEVPVMVRNIQLISQEGSDLELRQPIEIGGIAKQSGNYTVEIEPNVIWDTEHTTNTTWPKVPPKKLGFYSEIKKKTYSYEFLFPIGASLGVIAVAISIWGIKSGERKRLVKHRVKA